MANKIPKRQLKEMFDAISADTDWDLTGDMLWGYFFFHHNEKDLKKAAKLLSKNEYRFVGIHEAEDENEKPTGVFVLHVEKVETHSVDSLYERNTELEAFAAAQELDSYDGMDVGPVDAGNDE